MTLLSTRTQFVKLSGRYDLVADTVSWANNGADFFIKAGQKWLDRRGDIYKAKGRAYQSITSGTWYAILQNCRSIEEVWISNSDREKWQLTKYDLSDIRETYNEDPALIDNGDPLYYAPVSVRVMPEVSSQLTIDEFGATTYTSASDHYGYNGLIFMPPADGTYTLEIHGLFEQSQLSNDSDTNFWTEQHEFVLVLAALRALEISYRNTAGVNDWEEAINRELFDISLDYANELSSEITQMEG